jgi:hypothetical protein
MPTIGIAYQVNRHQLSAMETEGFFVDGKADGYSYLIGSKIAVSLVRCHIQGISQLT